MNGAASGILVYHRRIGHAGSFTFTCRAVAQKLETQNKKEDQISIRTTPDNAESEVFWWRVRRGAGDDYDV